MKMTIKNPDDLAAERAAQERATAREKALAYLSATDWMVARLAETGKAIPPEVVQARAEARKAAQ